MSENRGCLLPAGPTLGPTLLGILTATLTLLVHSQPLCAQDSYFGQESYSIYPGWRGPVMQEGLLELTFRASIGRGLLLYAEGSTSRFTEAMAVMLEEGRISVKIQRQEVLAFGMETFPLDTTETEQIYVGESLNDNVPHTLSLQQTADQFMVSVLDRSASGSSRLLARSSNIGSMRVHIGGLPGDVMPLFSTSGNFRGCLGDIQYANNSANASALDSVTPLEQQGIVEGCSDPCVSVSCGDGAGRCVALLPDSSFCDCSSSPLGGANCTEDLSMHRLNQALDSYLCYALDNFPTISSSASVRLLAPLPQTGTIMTGVSSIGDQFNLYLEERILKFELISVNRSVRLRTNQVLDISTSYQIDFEIRNDRVDLALTTLSQNGSTVVERLNGSVTFPVSTFFTTVCLGGTMLEIPYYVGLLERVIYNAVSLSDRSIVQQFATEETPVNLISIDKGVTDPPPLTFSRFNFATFQRLTFEMRMEPDEELAGIAGTPLASSGGDFDIEFSTFNGMFAIFGSNSLRIFCTNTPSIIDNEWHRIDLTLLRNSDGTADFSLIVDDRSCVSSGNSQLGEMLDSLGNLSAPLRFGVNRLDSSMLTLARFIGCFRNIEFSETVDSEPLRPDLASAIRAEERFSTGEDRCYLCMQKATSCVVENGEVCADCGYLHSAQCLDSRSNCPAVPTPPNTTTTSSTQPATTTSMPPTGTIISETTVDSVSSTNPPSSPEPRIARAQLGLYIGIAIGAAAVIIIIVIIAILLLCLCVRVRAGGQGFYKTEESNGKAMTMLHYSASLRQIASEQVTMAETNGVSPMHADGLRAKEFYM